MPKANDPPIPIEDGPQERMRLKRPRCGSVLNILLLIFLSSQKLSARNNLQSFVNSLMRGGHGAVIASNPATGELLAVWNPSVAFDRAFPPGSTAKLVASAAALEEGVLLPDDQIFCRRVPELLGDAYHCSHPPADGPFTVVSALANSCNYFFAALSLRLTSASLAHWYAVFGFGSPVVGVGADAIAGQIRIPEREAGKARAVLGEETVLVTPAQLLLAYSGVATRGPVFRLWPHGSSEANRSRLIRRIKLQSRTFDLLNSAFIQCVQSGTGHAAFVTGFPVAGKTGTAAAIDGSGVTHAWFAGYAPAGAPEIAVVTFLERGTGAHDAAPLAGKIMKHYFESKGEGK